MLAGRSTASWACRLVNDVSAALLEERSGLRIYFGLHATSIGENFADLAPLDPRVTIIWEDAGGYPIRYEPQPSRRAATASTISTAEETLDYSKTPRVAAPRTAPSDGPERLDVPLVGGGV